MTQTVHIGMVAGEASGDILGSDLIQAIKRRYTDIQFQFEGVGGPLMCAAGFTSHINMERLSVMGLVEPLKRLPELLRVRRNLINHFLAQPPDLFLGIDSPDFNLAIEYKLKSRHIKTAHYVSPSVWAWRQKRIHRIANSVDLMLTLFPFETAIYQQHGVAVEFVGHPLADQFAMEPDTTAAREALGYTENDRVLALLPGSRGGEVKLLAPLFLEVAAACHGIDERLQFVLPAANAQRRQQIQQLLPNYQQLPLKLIDGNSHMAMAAADVVLMASGTTTLEALLLKKPMVVAYKMAPMSYAIISRLVKSEFISLPNLLAGEALVPELLQHDARVDTISPLVMERFDNRDLRTDLTRVYSGIHQQLKQNASVCAATALMDLINR